MQNEQEKSIEIQTIEELSRRLGAAEANNIMLYLEKEKIAKELNELKNSQQEIVD